MLERTLRKDRTEVTFILPADNPSGPVRRGGRIHFLTSRR